MHRDHAIDVINNIESILKDLRVKDPGSEEVAVHLVSGRK